MLSTFRRLIYSKVGAAVAVVLLGLLAFLMVSGDMSSTRMQGIATVAGGDEIASIGDTRIAPGELQRRVEGELDGARQQNPQVDMAQFVNAGGFDAVLQRLLGGLALERFGQDQGMAISRRAVDGQIASFPGLQGPDGKFDQNAFRQALRQNNMSEAGLRGDLARSMLGDILTAPILRANVAPRQLALPYANLSLERREGVIAFVPTRAVATGPAPTAAEVEAFYRRNLPRYTVAERRTIRVARITPELVRARATPTDADIARAYQADQAKYAATEKRTVTQAPVLNEAAGTRLATAARGGQSLSAAASAAGVAATTLPALTKAELATRTSQAAADAVFAAPNGGVVGPVRGGLGFVVARVDKVEQVAGRPLAQVRGEIAAALLKTRTDEALNTLREQIDGATATDTFDEIVQARGLSAQTTPALLSTGVDPDRPGPPDATLAPLAAAAFGMNEGEEPQLVPLGADGSFALVALGRVEPAAARPLAQVRDQVTRDLTGDRARQAARRVAGQILQRVGRGASMADAWAQSGVRSEGPKPLNASRELLGRAQGPSRAPLALLFAMAPNTVKLLEAPGGGGWAVIRLNRIIPGDASRDQARIDGIRQEFNGIVGREYAEQFGRAAQVAVGVKTNPTAVARVRNQLLGRGGGAAN